MHIVIDLQGAQTASRQRGIGRSSENLALALARLASPQHRVTLLLNTAFAASIDPIRAAFAALPQPPEIALWQPLSAIHAADPANAWRRAASEAIYEAAVAKLAPDAVLITSLFEGMGDDSVCAIGNGTTDIPTAVILHDLIPLLHPDRFFDNHAFTAWYHNRLAHLRRANFLLAVSESSRREGIRELDFPENKIVNISSSISSKFQQIKIDKKLEGVLRQRYGLSHPFIMNTGALDRHKNTVALLTAFTDLPLEVRNRYQLALIYSAANPLIEKELRAIAKNAGMAEGQLALLGNVPDEDLVALYNLCHLFVFPSLHEGFGLPTLEAMACGAPTLASNTSSLPEVVGWDEALFDPLDQASIARSLEKGLTDTAFRAQLKKHALKQSKRFSWEASARRALTALEEMVGNRVPKAPSPRPRRPLLAYVSPLPPAASGIADYSAELLPELAGYYDIDVVVAQDEAIIDPWVLGNAAQRSPAWFEANAHRYDRVLYQMGNSPFHWHMFDLLERIPGVIVLHDFFLSGALSLQEYSGITAAWSRALHHAHGWKGLMARAKAKDPMDAVYAYPCNLAILQRALGVIVHGEHSRRLATQWYGADFAAEWAIIPHLRAPARGPSREQARAILGLGADDFLVCSFGLMDTTKLNHRLLAAWLNSNLARDPHCRLVFVGGEHGGEYGARIRQLMRDNGRIAITGRVEQKLFRTYLAAADAAVQLRRRSRGETSGTALDCMNYGLPTIVNAHGSLADLPADAVRMLPDEFTDEELRQALEMLRSNVSERRDLGERAQAYIRAYHQPGECARHYTEAIEEFYQKFEQQSLTTVRRLAHLGPPSNSADLGFLAERLTQLHPPKSPSSRQLLVDISELHQRDAKSGIQRVVRNVLRELLMNPPAGYRVEAVYATRDQDYRYARRFTMQFLGLTDGSLEDAPVVAGKGDIFWGIDLTSDILPAHEATLNLWREHGVRIVFTVHDLIPIYFPHTCDIGIVNAHVRWLESLARVASGLLCTTHKVAENCIEWLSAYQPQTERPIGIGWVPLGADVLNEDGKSLQSSPEQARQLAAIARSPSFLMVGTLEPRKAYAQALAAFELLWRQDRQVNLVIVGKKGWNIEDLAVQLQSHPERERRLFWLQGIEDGFLEQLYKQSVCLLAASLDEGFGLPLVEAARHGLPVLARDIPVFHEVTAGQASYFSGLAPEDIADAVEAWLANHAQGLSPHGPGTPWLSWAEATQQMLRMVLEDGWQMQWNPDKQAAAGVVARYWGSDPRLHTAVGERRGRALLSSGRQGHLLYGPYLSLKPGRYDAVIHGTLGPFGVEGGAVADVSAEGGKALLVERIIRAGEPNVLARLPFTLRETAQGVEVRVFVDEQSDLSITGVDILQAKGETPEPPAHLAGEPLLIKRYWATHPAMASAMGYRQGRSLHTVARAGHLLHGPYISLPAGCYRANLFGEVQEWGRAEVDVVSDKGRCFHDIKELVTNEVGEGIIASIEFALDSYTTDLEVRLLVAEESRIRVDGIVLSELEPSRATAISEPTMKNKNNLTRELRDVV